jgi:hypothetical protein
MANSKKVKIVGYDDWWGIYVDGKLFYQDHEIPNSILLEAYGMKLDETEVDGEWMYNEGQLPEKLSDIPKEALGNSSLDI